MPRRGADLHGRSTDFLRHLSKLANRSGAGNPTGSMETIL